MICNKMLHIGGDEVNLGDEDRKDYVRFLSDMCLYLKEKGIETGIWGDMFIKHPEMAADMNKDVHIFDWWYYGHRPQSTKMLKSAGFKNIVVCRRFDAKEDANVFKFEYIKNTNPADFYRQGFYIKQNRPRWLFCGQIFIYGNLPPPLIIANFT